MNVSPSKSKFREMADLLVPAIFNSVTVWDEYEAAKSSKYTSGDVLRKMERIDEDAAEDYGWRDVKSALLHLEQEGYVGTAEVWDEEKFDFETVNSRDLAEYHVEVSPDYFSSAPLGIELDTAEEYEGKKTDDVSGF